MKPYIILEYLMKNSDMEHAVAASDIIDYLVNDCGIEAERRSIYRDIDDINKVLYMLENDCTFDEAVEALEGEYGEEDKFIVYDKSLKDMRKCPPLRSQRPAPSDRVNGATADLTGYPFFWLCYLCERGKVIIVL